MEGTEAEALQEEILQKKAEARVGTTLRGKWKLDALIGVGGMGAVYEATHRNGMRGAVKLLHPERAADNNVKQRFMREGYIANKIDHVGAVRVLDDDDSDGTVFLVMELLEGHNIEMRALRSEGLMSAEETMIAMDQVLDTLVAAHDKGIIHRDLKPANIFITKNGIVKILDYGIARLTEAAPSASASTEMGIGMGTPAFMAPEQARGRWDEVDGRSDIWSVGATMFWMLSGTTVHDEGTGPEMLAATFLVQARPLRSVAKNVPRPLAAVVDRALMLDKKERWSSAREMQRALREAYEEIHGQPLPGPQPTQHLSMPRISAPSFGSLERTSDVDMAKRALLSTPSAHPPQEPKDAKVAKSNPVVMVPQVDGSNRERVPPASLVPRPKKFSTPFIAALAGTVVVVAALALVFSSSKTEPKIAAASAEVASAAASGSAPSFTAHEIATSNPTPRETPSVAPTVTSLKELVASSKKPKGAASNAPPVPKADGGAPPKAPPPAASTQKPDPETIF